MNLCFLLILAIIGEAINLFMGMTVETDRLRDSFACDLWVIDPRRPENCEKRFAKDKISKGKFILKKNCLGIGSRSPDL